MEDVFNYGLGGNNLKCGDNYVSVLQSKQYQRMGWIKVVWGL
jgi:hypothetical protein